MASPVAGTAEGSGGSWMPLSRASGRRRSTVGRGGPPARRVRAWPCAPRARHSGRRWLRPRARWT